MPPDPLVAGLLPLRAHLRTLAAELRRQGHVDASAGLSRVDELVALLALHAEAQAEEMAELRARVAALERRQ